MKIEYQVRRSTRRGNYEVGARDPRAATCAWRWLQLDNRRKPSDAVVNAAKDRLRREIRDEWLAEAADLLQKALAL